MQVMHIFFYLIHNHEASEKLSIFMNDCIQLYHLRVSMVTLGSLSPISSSLSYTSNILQREKILSYLQLT